MKNFICFISLFICMISITAYSVEPIIVPHHVIGGNVPIVTNIVEYVKGECADTSLSIFYSNADYILTNLSDNVELRLFSGEIVTANYDGIDNVNVIIDVSDKSNYRSTDTLLILNSQSNGLMKVSTKSHSTIIPSIIKKKKGENPLEVKSGSYIYTFSKIGYENGSNIVYITTQEID